MYQIQRETNELSEPIVNVLFSALEFAARVYEVQLVYKNFSDDYIRFRRSSADLIFAGLSRKIMAKKGEVLEVTVDMVEGVIKQDPILSKELPMQIKLDSEAAQFLNTVEAAIQSILLNSGRSKGKVVIEDIAKVLSENGYFETNSQQSSLRQLIYLKLKEVKEEVVTLLREDSLEEHWPNLRKLRTFRNLAKVKT